MEDRPIEVGWGKTKDEGIGQHWFVFCRVNDLFRKHRNKIWRCPMLIERIVERCRLVYQSLNFHLRWMEVYFTENGPGIDVDGDRCGIFPMGGGMGDYIDHNVDDSNQVFCLYLCIRAAMDEVENAIEFWEERDGGASVESSPIESRLRFRFTKDLTKWGLFRVRVFHPDEPSLDCEKYIWAKGVFEAEDIVERQPDLFDGHTLVDEVTAGPPLMLSSPVVQEPDSDL